jgi:phosphoesterase RecJ-like protein
MKLPPSVPELRAALTGARTILLTGPLDPDGDSIGACLALARGLATVSEATVTVAGEANYRYDWMPGAAQMVGDKQVASHYDVVVVMDGDRTRLTDAVSKAFDAATTRCIVDHHRSTSVDGYDVVVLDPDATSTCEMVHAMLRLWGIDVDAAIAKCIYTGIVFDTGGFRHSNTKPETHRLAADLLELGVDPSAISAKVLAERTPAGLRLLGDVLARAEFYDEGRVVVGQVPLSSAETLGIASGDLDGVIDALVNTAGVEVACLAVERAPDQTKLSLRSRHRVNVAELAQRIDPGGGGHARAAGVTLTQPLSGVMERLPVTLCEAVIAAS